jgi:very-short-patch-repair endonuclease
MTKKMGEIIALADERHGVILGEELARIGVGNSTRQRLVKEGILHPIHRGTVFALGRSTLDIAAEIAAACWAVPDGWASGNTAAEYWGLRRLPRGRIEISTHAQRSPRLNGVRIRRTNLPDPAIIHLPTGGAVSSPAQTLFEIAHETDDRTLMSAFEDCLNRNLASLAEIRAFGSRAVKMGRPGSKRFRRVILGRPDELPIAMSHAEMILAKALADEDFRWLRQHKLLLPGNATAIVDIARPDIKLGVEVDGGHHDSPIKVHSDKRRDIASAHVGWQILRPTTEDIETSLRSLVAQILTIAELRSRQLGN